MEPYELLSDAFSVFVELLKNVFTAIIKLSIIIACMTTTCIDLFAETLVAMQSSSGVLQILVQKLQDLFTLVEAILLIMQQVV